MSVVGHRAWTTRIIAQAVQILNSEERNAARLRQIETALREKLGVLEKLDAEIIDLTLTEEALAEEIEQADACKKVMLLELVAALATGHGCVSTATSHGSELEAALSTGHGCVSTATSHGRAR